MENGYTIKEFAPYIYQPFMPLNIIKGMNMEKKTIFVTGSEGSLAQWVIKYFKKEYNVIGIDNFCRYGKIERDRDYKFYEGDCFDLPLLDKIFAENDIDFIFHSAARIYGVKGFHERCADILGYDTAITTNVLEMAKKYNITKVAFTSSSMVYERCETVPSKETDLDQMKVPFTDYGLSKLTGERLVQSYSKQYGIDYVVWRPFNVITPLEKADGSAGDSHVFADFIKKIAIDKNEECEIFGNGQQIRCFTWIDDIAQAIATWSFDDTTNNQVYNLGTHERTKMIDLAEMIWNLTRPGEEFKYKFVEIFKDDVKIRVPDSTKAFDELGFKNTRTLPEIIVDCIDYATR